MNLWYKWVCNQHWLYLPVFFCFRWIRSSVLCLLFEWYPAFYD